MSMNMSATRRTILRRRIMMRTVVRLPNIHLRIINKIRTTRLLHLFSGENNATKRSRRASKKNIIHENGTTHLLTINNTIVRNVNYLRATVQRKRRNRTIREISLNMRLTLFGLVRRRIATSILTVLRDVRRTNVRGNRRLLIVTRHVLRLNGNLNRRNVNLNNQHANSNLIYHNDVANRLKRRVNVRLQRRLNTRGLTRRLTNRIESTKLIAVLSIRLRKTTAIRNRHVELNERQSYAKRGTHVTIVVARSKRVRLKGRRHFNTCGLATRVIIHRGTNSQFLCRHLIRLAHRFAKGHFWVRARVFIPFSWCIVLRHNARHPRGHVLYQLFPKHATERQSYQVHNHLLPLFNNNGRALFFLPTMTRMHVRRTSINNNNNITRPNERLLQLPGLKGFHNRRDGFYCRPLLVNHHEQHSQLNQSNILFKYRGPVPPSLLSIRPLSN